MSDLLCDFEAPYLLFFSVNPPTLLYYSHFIAILSALILLFVLLKNKNTRTKSLFLTMAMILFVIWAFIDMFLWATNESYLSIFWWSIQILVEPIIYVLAIGATYNFFKEKFPPFWGFFTASIVLLPLIILLPTDLTLYEVNLFDCIASESTWIVFYTYFIEIMSIVILLLLASYIIFFSKSTSRKASESITFVLGLIAFLVAFTSGNVIGSLTEDWVMAQYGLFGLPIFIAIIGYLVVKFKTYNINIIASQVLVVALISLIAALIFVSENNVSILVSSITLILTLGLGILLIRSVKKEVKQRKELQELTKKLAVANDKLKELDKLKSEFVSIASHQLRSPLTAIRGYASLLADGSYGKLPKKAEEALDRISESSKNMAYSIEDYLNVSRIESGNMKYNYADLNLKEEVEKITDDLRTQAIKKGLVLLFRSDLKSKGIINADVGKVVQIIQNLINNSIKYTPEGSIKVLVRDDVVRKKIFVDIIDTGIGMNEKSLGSIFGKFERADNANTANIHGTGLGLFVAHEMVVAMGGDITATSEGDGEGSTFTIEFPLAL